MARVRIVRAGGVGGEGGEGCWDEDEVGLNGLAGSGGVDEFWWAGSGLVGDWKEWAVGGLLVEGKGWTMVLLEVGGTGCGDWAEELWAEGGDCGDGGVGCGDWAGEVWAEGVGPLLFGDGLAVEQLKLHGEVGGSKQSFPGKR
ncbi:PE-PGRS family protein PE_PGRS61-like [Helianthus annuus]|uniref:PE-PGRS family protein PE_PGRS61-like n=1 Tax=Helianthus annuus TaxID=4232 RepID=UPI000B9073A4|nr:PE-PGRS family protein PE_PGRS61-like [Helianthus annuus]